MAEGDTIWIMFGIFALCFAATGSWHVFLISSTLDPANTWAAAFSFLLGILCLLAMIVALRRALKKSAD